MLLVEFTQGGKTVSVNPASIVLIQEGGNNNTAITLNIVVNDNPRIIVVDDSYKRVCNLVNDALEKQ